jgi:predicted peptidase
MAARHPDLFAAIAPLCGGGDPGAVESLKSLPTWAFYGDQDRPEGLQRCKEMIEALKSAGDTAQITVYPGVGHNCWDKAYRDEKLSEWFLQFQRK